MLALIMNLSIWTAPGSIPITDTAGEVLRRPVEYFSSGTTDEPAGEGAVTFHHRTISELLNANSDGGWGLQRMIETPHHGTESPAGDTSTVACRWRVG